MLAAGLSTRMGQVKQLMPWGDKIMVRHVVDTLLAGGVEAWSVRVVVGHCGEAVTAAVDESGARTVVNPLYADGSMLRSLQVGLASLAEPAAEADSPAAALVALGDQPQIKAEVVRRVIERWQRSPAAVIAPSFGKQRGHPILFARSIWPEILAAAPVGSPRDFLNAFAGSISYLEIDDDAVLRDIDTPEDYRRELERRV